MHLEIQADREWNTRLFLRQAQGEIRRMPLHRQT
jgi:hypothetical protein